MGTDSLRLGAIGQASLTSSLATGSQIDSYRVALITSSKNTDGDIADEHLITSDVQTAHIATGAITYQTGGSQGTVVNAYGNEVAQSTYDAYMDVKMSQVEDIDVPPPYVPPAPPPPPPVYKPPVRPPGSSGGPSEF